MRINSINTAYNYAGTVHKKVNKNINKYQNDALAFKGRISSSIYNENIGSNSASYYFRNDLNWKQLKEYLTDKFKDYDKVNTYIWGCADGQEAYSFAALAACSSGGSKFYPVHAMDINPVIIKRNKIKQLSGVSFDNDALGRIRKNLSGMDCLEPEKYIDEVPPIITGRLHKFKESIVNQVQFSCSDIISDLDKIDGSKPSIIMCRNMWPYINPENYDKCAETMYNKLGSGSVVIIGAYDVTGEPFVEKSDSFPLSLIQAGFKQKHAARGISAGNLEDQPLIYEK